MKAYLILIGTIFLLSSCNMDSFDIGKNSETIDSLRIENAALKAKNDSLKAELAYVAKLNQKIYKERETVKEELNSLKKKYNIRSSEGDPLGNYNLKLTRAKTGYVYSNYDALFLPAITLEFKNTANIDLTQRVYLKYIFINKATGEQLYEGTKEYSDSYNPVAGGLVKQITKRSEVGWSAIRNQKVSVRVYVRDQFWKEFNIENETYEGRI
jgi:FtsZ-binding cell division protein ZapB